MANPSLQIGSGNWAIKADELLGYRVVGNKYFPVPIDVSRATAATRVDEAGLVDYAEILGGEEVINGDFTDTGSDLIVNGIFDTTIPMNTAGSGWFNTTTALFYNVGGVDGMKVPRTTLSAYGIAVKADNSNLLTANTSYKISYEVLENNGSGGVYILAGAGTGVNGAITTGVTHTIYITSGASDYLRFYNQTNNSDYTITNVTCEELGEGWTLGTGWSIGDNRAIVSPTGSTIYLSQNFTTVNGQYYKIEYEILSSSLVGATYFALSSSSAFGFLNISTAVGTHTYYREVIDDTATDAFKVFSSSNSGSLEITNISVEESTRDNIARIDYTDGSSPHLLSEPQRTNLLTQSNQFDTTWVQSGTLTSGQDGVGGSTDAWKFQNPNSTSSLYQPDTTSGVQTLSAYFKKNSNYGVRFYAFGSINCSAFFDLNNGAVVVEFNSTAKIETVGDDWFRCSMTFDQTNTRCDFYVTNNASTQVLGDYTIQYAQLEEGSYPTSYIPTSGATVTRNQDQFSRDGISSLINSTEGCVFGEGNFAESNSSSYNYFVSLSDGTSSNRLEVRQSSPNLQFLWRVATYQSEISTSSLDVSSNFKFALNYSAANIKFYVNGDLIGTINTPTLWSVNTLNRLAFDDGTGGNRLSGKVKQLQVYPTALTDEQLIELTGVTYSSYLAMANALNYTIQ